MLDLLAKPYCQDNEDNADGRRPGNTRVQYPLKPLDTTILDQTIVEAYERQSNESRGKCKGELGDEGDFVGWFDLAQS